MENPNLQDIPDYDNYKLDKVLLQVYNTKKNKYLKNNLYKDGSYYVSLFKNGKGIKYNIRQIVYMCNPIENKNLVDIPNYDNYKFDKVLLQVYNIKTDKYLKNILDKGNCYVGLWKNCKGKTYSIRQLIIMCNRIENKNLVDIPNYDNYKFDKVLLQVYNIDTDKYLKNIIDKDGYYQVNLYKNKIIKRYGIHQLVYIINNPTDDIIGFEIDHIDGNPQNNKIENLRKATRSDNCSNKKTQKNNKLGIKYIIKTKWNTYRFTLRKNKIKYTKHFKKLEDAIAYRDIKVKEICGEFANLG